MQRRLAAGSRCQSGPLSGSQIVESTEQSDQQNERQSSAENSNIAASRVARTSRVRIAQQSRLDFDFENGSQSQRPPERTAESLSEVPGSVSRGLGKYSYFNGVVVAWFQIAQQNDRLRPSRIREELPESSAEKLDRRAGGESVPSQEYRQSGAGRARGRLAGPAGRRSRKCRWTDASSGLDRSALAPGRAGGREAALARRRHAHLVSQTGSAVETVTGSAPDVAALALAVSALADVAVVVPARRQAADAAGQPDLAVTSGSAGRTDARVARYSVDARRPARARIARALIYVYSTVRTGEARRALASEPVNAVDAASTVQARQRLTVVDVPTAVRSLEALSADTPVTAVSGVDARRTVLAGTARARW